MQGFDFKGRTIFVAGGTSGIDLEIAGFCRSRRQSRSDQPLAATCGHGA